MSTLDQAMNYLADLSVASHTTITPSHGSSYASWGGCGYWVYGKVVLHMGLSNVTSSTTKVVYTMPQGLRPVAKINVMGGAQTTATFSTWSVNTNGQVTAYTTNGYANATIAWIIP